MTSPRIILFGRHCRLSTIPLEIMLDRGIEVVAVIVPATRVPGRAPRPPRRLGSYRAKPRLPMVSHVSSSGIDQLAGLRGIPIYQAEAVHRHDLIGLVANFRPDVLVVSCFPFRLPAALRAVAHHGALNLHPSLLPRHRGPDPLFWVYRNDEREAGVTIHRMTDELDAGPIVTQLAVPFDPGTPGDQLESYCSRVGGKLLADSVLQLSRAQSVGIEQDDRAATYETWPSEDDLQIPLDWTATRAYHFARGVVPLGYQPTVEINGTRFVIRDAVALETAGYVPGRESGPGAETLVGIGFDGGTLVAHVARVADETRDS